MRNATLTTDTTSAPPSAESAGFDSTTGLLVLSEGDTVEAHAAAEWERLCPGEPMPAWFPETFRNESGMLGGTAKSKEDWRRLTGRYGPEPGD